MRRHIIVALVITTCAGEIASPQDLSRLYSQEKLQADATRWSEQIQAEYRDTLLPELTDEERGALAAVRIEVPLAGPNGDPFAFYTDDKSTIHLPALSLRFFSDLCVANAWLNSHGYDGTAVRNYVGLLFYQALTSPRAPSPQLFRTLDVPDNARDESAVSNRADRNFGNTVVFLLAHELGHVLKRHRTDLRNLNDKRQQEIEADAFAIEMMRRIGQIPVGVELWFDLEQSGHVAPRKFATAADWQKYLTSLDHPVTTERLEALAAAIEKAPDSFARKQTNQAQWIQRSRMLAQYFRLSAPQWSTNPIAHAADYERVDGLHLSDLKPRQAAFTIPGSAHEPEFNGLFGVRRTAAGGGQDNVDLLLLRMGNEVTGGYSNGKIDGFVEGEVRDGVLHFSWREGTRKGKGALQVEGDTLRGHWGIDQIEQGGGEWTGVRQKKENAAP
jgi:hypothetical protein